MALTQQKIDNFERDLADAERIVNGGPNETVTTRLGLIANTFSKTLNDIALAINVNAAKLGGKLRSEFYEFNPSATNFVPSFVGSKRATAGNAPDIAGATKIVHTLIFPELVQDSNVSAHLLISSSAVGVGGLFSLEFSIYAGSTTFFPYTMLDLGGNTIASSVYWADHNGEQVIHVEVHTPGTSGIFWSSVVESFRRGFSVTEFEYLWEQVV